ncbi:dienelactone hydrolase family protein [Paraglaciecola sp.]|nr:dienelactone hydrolase family protein [Paraglaciecola sp.]
MSKLVKIIAEDGFKLPAYLSRSIGEAKGAIVLIQEIFGITKQLRELADQYSALGYDSIVPALFARVSNDIELEYSQAAKGLELVSKIKQESILYDIHAAITALDHKQVSVIGFCWGGGLAYLAASELNLHSGAAFYPTRLLSYLPKKPKCAFQFHFAENDTHSPADVIQQMQQSAPDCKVFIYPQVDHAFANHHKSSFDQDSTSLAQSRVVKMLTR